MNRKTPSTSSLGRAFAIALSPSCRRAFAAALASVGVLLTSTPAAFAASDTWDNGAADNLWQSVTNWAADTTFPGAASAVYTSTDDATFSTTAAGGTIDLGGTLNVRSLIFGVSSGDAASFTIGDANDILNFTTAGGITINSGVTTAQNIGVSGTTINLSTDASAATTFTNNGTGLLTIAANIAANTTSGNGVLTVGGTGNTTVTGTITKPGAGSNALKKTGSGTLTLSNGSVWSGTGATQTANSFTGPLIVQEGTLLLNGGTHAVTGEIVVGGVTTVGGAGQNAKIQLDAGSLTSTSYLSLGRGNGTGSVSSDLVVNNAASVSVANFSAGFNGGSALNLPKGTVTLNNSSSFTVTGNGVFRLGESSGSNMTMTMNGTSNLAVTGTGTHRVGEIGSTGALTLNDSATATFGGTTSVGYGAGSSGTLTINGGTVTTSILNIAQSTAAANAVTGAVTVGSGGTLTTSGDLVVGLGGTQTGTLTINGGTVNTGTTTQKWLVMGQYDTVNATLNINSGTLKLNTNTDIRAATITGTASTSVVNQNSGDVTFYSNNGSTVGGSGIIDMQRFGSASMSSTYNLNGGTLTANKVTSTYTGNSTATTTTSTTATGTRTFNFNGGTLKVASNTYASDFFNLGTGTGTARANIRNGGALIDTNGFDVTVAQALLHSNVGGDLATDGGLTKSGTGILTLSGANTYNGDTTINAGTLTIAASTGSLLFDVTDSDSTQMLGTGAVNFNGTLKLNLSGVTVGSGSWTLINVGTLTESFAGTFSVADNSGTLTFTENSNVWTSNNGIWSFTEATGILSLSAIPEPSTYAVIAGLGVLALAGCRRRRNA